LEIEFFSVFDFSVIKSIDGVKTIRQEDVKNKEDETRSEKSLKLFIKVNNAETVLPVLISTINKLNPNIIKIIRIEKPGLETIFLELTGRRFKEVEEEPDRQFYTNIR
jgi:ABC-2 type transport system ATP-binding protein